MTDDLRAALESAMVDLADDQAHAAHALIAALTPPMEEPTWPGAPVIAACSGGTRESLHVRRIDEDFLNWECWECDCFCAATKWHLLGNRREQVRLAGNAVTPPSSRDLIAVGVEALGGAA